MEFDVKLTEASVYRFFKQRAFGGQYGRMTVLGGVIIMALGAILLYQNYEGKPMYGIVMIVMGVLLLVSMPFNIRSQAKTAVQDPRPDHYKITENHLEYTHCGNENVILWSKIGDVYEYPEGLLIDFHSNQITLIPKCCVNELYEEIKACIAQYAKIVPRTGTLFEKKK